MLYLHRRNLHSVHYQAELIRVHPIHDEGRRGREKVEKEGSRHR